MFTPSTVTLVNGQATFTLTPGSVGTFVVTGTGGGVSGTTTIVVANSQTDRLVGPLAVGSGEPHVG